MNRKKEIIALKEKVSTLIDKNYELNEKINSIHRVLVNSDILENEPDKVRGVTVGRYKSIWNIGGIKRINDKREQILFKLIDTLGYEYKE